MLVSRTERTVLRETCEQFKLLQQLCFEAKNLYNYGNYILRQNYKAKDFELHNFYKLRHHIRYLDDFYNPWSRQATAHVAAEVLQSLVNAWKGYFSSKKSFTSHPEKFKKCPRPPKYLPKNGAFVLTVTSSGFRLRDGFISFPKAFQGLCVAYNKPNKVQVVRIIPGHRHFVIEVVYQVDVPQMQPDNGRYLSIDLGVDNFAAITSNVSGFRPLLLNGKGLKSINQYYNKQRAHYQAVSKQMNGVYSTNRLRGLDVKRNRRVNDIMHKMSRYVIDLAVSYDCSRIVIGYNPGWKDGVELGSKTNQNFVQLPYLRFIQQLTYKAENVGKRTEITEESYTSKTSFLDDEFPEKRESYVGKRVKRGLYRSSEGIEFNADVNASYQITKKVFPNAYSNGIAGVLLHPEVVNVA